MLNREIAQKIVNKMMETVPYNINIMDDDGVIIGSGDESRIGMLHYGAAEAITKKNEVCIYKGDEYVKEGVNIPIVFKDEIVGVIGITGSPSEVINFTKIIKVTAELLLGEHHRIKTKMINKKIKSEFLYEWIYRKSVYDEDMIIRAKSLNIDILKNRCVLTIYIEGNNNERIKNKVNEILDLGEYVVWITKTKLVILIHYDECIDQKIKNIYDSISLYNVKIGVGNYHDIINKSLLESLHAISVGNKIYENTILIYYDKIRFYHKMFNKIDISEMKNISNKIMGCNGGEDLMETLIKYVEFNGEKNIISNMLHIHRNTLNYRIKKIEELTDLQLNNYLDLYKFISFYLYFKSEYQKNVHLNKENDVNIE